MNAWQGSLAPTSGTNYMHRGPVSLLNGAGVAVAHWEEQGWLSMSFSFPGLPAACVHKAEGGRDKKESSSESGRCRPLHRCALLSVLLFQGVMERSS